MRIQGGIPVGGNLAGVEGLYSQPGSPTLEYIPSRDSAPPRTMEWDFERDGPFPGLQPLNETIAGSPGYRPSEREINDRLFRYGLERNPQMQQNIQRIREMIRNTSPVQSAGVFGNIGNAGGILSSDMPPGFQNKLVF